jgi:hypothetical protein
MNFQQLELKLNLALEDAAAAPALADLQRLWAQVEPVLEQLPIREQLRLGSEVIEHLAGIYQAKAHYWLEDWENTYDPQDPAFSGDWLQGFVRQSQQLDLSELTAPVRRRPRKPKDSQKTEQDSVVGEVPKANVLKMLDQVDLEAQKETALAVAHEERIQDWVGEIHRWFDQYPQPLPLRQLQQQLGWPLVQLWLSLLLGGFCLEPIGDHFYSAGILISRP